MGQKKGWNGKQTNKDKEDRVSSVFVHVSHNKCGLPRIAANVCTRDKSLDHAAILVNQFRIEKQILGEWRIATSKILVQSITLRVGVHD